MTISIRHRWFPVSAALAGVAAIVIGCSDTTSPVMPGAAVPQSAAAAPGAHGHAHGLDQDKGFIDGWANGQDVNLFYTKIYFCEEPPTSGAPTDCVVGADAEVPPRGGPIPTIYALAAVGFQPDPATLACRAGTTCLNHPAMIDVSRLGNPAATSIPGLPHSHILEERRGGWFHTVNIRVFSLDAWNQIASAKSLAKVRELQGNPLTGTPGVISGDTPTNIFFFIASYRDE